MKRFFAWLAVAAFVLVWGYCGLLAVGETLVTSHSLAADLSTR